MKTIIAFHGRKQTGKSTAAEILVATYGARLLSFAEPLRSIVSHAFGFTNEMLRDPARKEAIDSRYGVTPRWLLQRIGDGLRSGLGQGVLVKALIDRVVAEDGPLYVVDDCRYQYELATLRQLEDRHPLALAGYVVHLERTDAAPSTDQHASETETDVSMADVDGWIRWSDRDPLRDQIPREMGRLCSLYPPVRRAFNLAVLRGSVPIH
jgi:hypothetical protein